MEKEINLLVDITNIELDSIIREYSLNPIDAINLFVEKLKNGLFVKEEQPGLFDQVDEKTN